MPNENPKLRNAAASLAELLYAHVPSNLDNWAETIAQHAPALAEALKADGTKTYTLALTEEQREFLLYVLGYAKAGQHKADSAWASPHHFAILGQLR